jgi:prepilin-type N-terminal cleavage/methylation domain-containing protein
MAGLRAGVGRARRRHRRAVAGAGQAGFSLVELIVAMSIFAVILSIFGLTIVNFSNATARTIATSDQSTTSRTVYNLLDKQVRAADAINRPVLVGTNYYLEFRNSTVSPPICVQWVDRTATSTLAVRQWVTGGTTTVTPTDWRSLALDDVNATSDAQPPFAFTPATSSIPYQQLTVSLRFRQGTSASASVLNSSFTAANSSTSSVTNADVNNDGVSDTQVCASDLTSFRPTS